MASNVSPTPKLIKAEAQSLPKMNFYEALRACFVGRIVTKLEWNNPKIFCCLQDGHLKIKLEDNLLHDWIISDGDMMGDDWIVLE